MESERLIYRERTHELMQDLLTWSKVDQMKFYGFTQDEDLKTQLEYIRKGLSWYRADFKMWDMLLKDNDQVIGALGYHSWYFRHVRAEIGYALHPPFREQGYMKEALREIVAYGFEEMGLNRIEAFVGPENGASLHLLTSLGFIKEGYAREHYSDGSNVSDSVLLSLLKREYIEIKASQTS